ncbi:hypothetical protein I79_005584 [Cricetulus griseus]|uniref:Uncharacterized protein n=1 Tax=Cricetulus griseus TaxID=10029 RepID=G3H5K1_CRIGR|nr:hypothetical protein I79_005584 [Cricetulus griseus]
MGKTRLKKKLHSPGQWQKICQTLLGLCLLCHSAQKGSGSQAIFKGALFLQEHTTNFHGKC